MINIYGTLVLSFDINQNCGRSARNLRTIRSKAKKGDNIIAKLGFSLGFSYLYRFWCRRKIARRRKFLG